MREYATGRFWLARTLAAGSVFCTGTIICLEPASIAGRVIAEAGLVGFLAVVALMAVSLLAFADILINDAMPAKYTLRWARHYRHLVYMALALGSLSMAFVIHKYEADTAIVLRQLYEFIAASAIAALDIRHQWQEGATHEPA